MNSLADAGSMPGTALDTLGSVLERDHGRDAIHLATIAVEAAERLSPSQHIGLNAERKATSKADLIGIVDPFLPGPVFEGDLIWLVLYPRTITSLRHVWTHPAFPDEASAPAMTAKDISEKWLRDFIDHSDCPSYEAVIAAAIGEGASSWDPDFLHFVDQDAHGEIPPEFWDHVEVVTGRSIPRDERASYFSCAC